MTQFKTIFIWTLKRYRNLTVAISLGTFLWAALVVAIYPSYAEGLEGFEMPAAMSGLLGEAESIASPEGFIATEFFAFGIMLIIAIAITGGTAAVSGQEESGMLDLLLAQPVKRSTLLLAQVGALATLLLPPVLTSIAGFAVSLPYVEIEISSSNVYAACANMWPMSLLFLGICVLLSSALPTRSAAATAATGLLIVSFLVVMLGEQVAALDTIKKLSPFYWAEPSRVLINGFDWSRAALMSLLALPLFGAALWVFDQRDISVGLQIRQARFSVRRPSPESLSEEKPQPVS